MEVDLGILQALIDLVKEANLTELTIESKDSKISIKRAQPAPPYLEPLDQTYEPEVAISQERKEKEVLIHQGAPVVIRAPKVGILHWTLPAESKPMVSLGDKVEKGQVVCAIEALNFTDEVHSEVSGKVKKIFAEDGQPVEYGQELLLLEPIKE